MARNDEVEDYIKGLILTTLDMGELPEDDDDDEDEEEGEGEEEWDKRLAGPFLFWGL
jgi:hypothetical protein